MNSLPSPSSPRHAPFKVSTPQHRTLIIPASFSQMQELTENTRDSHISKCPVLNTARGTSVPLEVYVEGETEKVKLHKLLLKDNSETH